MSGRVNDKKEKINERRRIRLLKPVGEMDWNRMTIKLKGKSLG